MILYNVTVKIENESNEDWLEWMQTVHIPDVLKTGFFKEHKLCKIFTDDTDGVTYSIQYFCPSIEELQRYQKEFAPKLQAEHTERYKNKYVAFRTLMEVL